MTGRQFNTLVGIMFVGYVPMQIPSYVSSHPGSLACSLAHRNIFLNRLNRPSAYLSLCIFMWGIFSIITGSFAFAMPGMSYLRLNSAFR